MKLKTCIKCEFGTEKEDKSFCEFESCYSLLTKCIQIKAISVFLENDRIVEEN